MGIVWTYSRGLLKINDLFIYGKERRKINMELLDKILTKEIQKKNGKKRNLGIPTTHNIACSRKGYQLICKTDWLKFAINIERLRKRGLIFLLDQYEKVHVEIN